MKTTVTVHSSGTIRVPAGLCAAAGFRPMEFPIAFGWSDRAGAVFPKDQARDYPFPELFIHSIDRDGSMTLDMDATFGLDAGDVVALEATQGRIRVQVPLAEASTS